MALYEPFELRNLPLETLLFARRIRFKLLPLARVPHFKCAHLLLQLGARRALALLRGLEVDRAHARLG